MRDELLGDIQPVLSISLEPGESVLGTASQFAWMTDSIQLTPGDQDWQDGLNLSVYTAKGSPGVVAFAASRPGHVIGVEAAAGYLISGPGFVAGTSGVRVLPARWQGVPTREYRPAAQGPHGLAHGLAHGLVLWQITGSGRAWVGLAGDVVERELTANQSLRAQQDHVGMCAPTVTIQVTGDHGICVLSGPGTVWLQSRSGNS
jgi:uncharacterized protein (AIM24 family)